MQVKRAAVERVAAEFSAGSEITLEPGSGGHIHDTWFVTTRYDDFVLQRLNVGVFVDCVRMMENVLRVLSHLRSRVRKRRLPEPDRRVLTPVRARGGGALVFDEEGTPWRAFRRVERALSYEVGTSPAITFQIGRAFGQFFDDVQDLPGGPLPEAIVGFKDFVRRRRDFELVADADPYDRARSSKAEIEAVRHHHRLVDDLVSLRKRGLLRQRTVHNDARVNNVLLDAVTGEALCVIDLDTVGTGTVLYDFGDLLRSATVTAAEDDGDQPDLAVRDDLLQAAVRGYLREAGLLLTVDELSLLPLAGPLMAYENALRFLTDHLVGDVYYRISHPGQNLARCRTQLRVLDALTEAQGRVAELVRAAV